MTLERGELRHDRGTTELLVAPDIEVVAVALQEWATGRDVCVVTSDKLWQLHGRSALAPVSEAAASISRVTVADGEAAKTPASAESVWKAMLAAGLRRDCAVIAFGGGSIGDLAGFVAAGYMRGAELVQMPTTLLAQVDAAIGGKTAVNVGGVKNAVGAFHHPSKVVSVTALLDTLPERQVRSGLVEVVKMAALLDLALLDRVESDFDELLQPASAVRVPVVAAAQRAKSGVVERDPREAGERRVLNFGHTLGHALEVAAAGKLTHGEAVGWGIRFALELGVRRGLAESFRERLDTLLDRLVGGALPVTDAAALAPLLGHDKKAVREGVVWVVPTKPGGWEATIFPAEEVRQLLTGFVARFGAAC